MTKQKPLPWPSVAVALRGGRGAGKGQGFLSLREIWALLAGTLKLYFFQLKASTENKKYLIFKTSMGCPKLSYQNFSFLEAVHGKKATALQKKRLNEDHLGNVRLSYSDSNDDGLVDVSEIIEESNYYPFGLKHRGYNEQINGVSNKYKTFQGQELTENLGLNVHEWKYRVSDPAIGRFWQIDPLAEKYVWMTTYQFSSNQPIHAPELEGMENSFDLNQNRMLMDYMKGKKTKEEVLEWHKAQGRGGLIGASLIAPGPEDVILGAAVIKWIGGLFRAKKTVKATVEMADKAKDASKTTDKATDVKKMDDVVEETKDVSLKQKSDKVKTKNDLEHAINQREGIEKAQDAAKKAKKGEKQNKINSTKKSKQREKYQLKRIDINDIDAGI